MRSRATASIQVGTEEAAAAVHDEAEPSENSMERIGHALADVIRVETKLAALRARELTLRAALAGVAVFCAALFVHVALLALVLVPLLARDVGDGYVTWLVGIPVGLSTVGVALAARAVWRFLYTLRHSGGGAPPEGDGADVPEPSRVP